MQYKFKIQHGLAAAGFIVLGMMSFRSRFYDSDLSLISWMLVVVAITAAYASWFRSRLLTICILSWLAGSAVTWFRSSIIEVFCMNCFWAIRSERNANGGTFFINSTEHVVLVAVGLSVVSIVFGAAIGKLIGSYREWIKINFVSFMVLSLAVFVAGSLGFEYGTEIMPRVSRNLASLICAAGGAIFSGAWIGTNRPFVMPKTVPSQD